LPTSLKILDAWGVVAFLEGEEPHAEKFENILIDATEHDLDLVISVINLGEVWYSIARTYSEKEADRAVEQVRSIGIREVSADWEVVQVAARFKARGRIAYADCFSLALGKIHKAYVVTGDPEFRQFAEEVEIEWI
jgi:predicted nucleic acid-binding protein